MNMLRYAFVIFVLNVSMPVFAQNIEDNQLLWVKYPEVNDSLRSDSHSMTSDSDGNIYVCGQFHGTKKFGNFTVISSDYDGFIAKYTSEGTVAWIKQTFTLGGMVDGVPQSAGMQSIGSDSDGNLYVLGSADSVNFGNNTNLGRVKNGNRYFMAKYTKNGDILWSKRVNNNGMLTGLSVNQDGDVYIGGNFGYLARYNSDGERQTDGGTFAGNMGGRAITVDKDGNAFLVGGFAESGIYNYTKELQVKGIADGYIIKYQKNVGINWAIILGSDSSVNLVECIAADESGNTYIAGEFTKAVDFGQNIVFVNKNYTPAQNKRNFFISKISADGLIVWAREIIQSQKDGSQIENIAVDKNGFIYLQGAVTDSLSFGNNKTITTDIRDGFIAVYNPQGEVIDVRRTSHQTSYGYTSMALDNERNIYISGRIAHTMQFGKDTVINSGNWGTAYLAKYAPFNTTHIEESEVLKTNNILSIQPNPAHSTSRISFKTTAPSHTRLTLTDVLGRQTLLKEETLDAGEHSAEINTADFPAGIYVLTLEAGGQVFSQTVVIER